MDTNLYWRLRGTYAERKAKLAEFPREFLEAAILDSEYNEFIRGRANFRDGDKDSNGSGKRVPYIGWFWRHVAFSNLTSVPIGNCGEFIGFIENNKWDHPERTLTAEEGAKVMEIIDEAMRLNQQGGELGEIERSTNAKLGELWDFMQTLTIPNA